MQKKKEQGHETKELDEDARRGGLQGRKKKFVEVMVRIRGQSTQKIGGVIFIAEAKKPSHDTEH